MVHPVGDHRQLLRPGITPRRVHGLIELQSLRSFALDVQPGKLLDDDVRGAWAALELLTAAGCEAVIAEFCCELALSDLPFSSRPSTHHTLQIERRNRSDPSLNSLDIQRTRDSAICHTCGTVMRLDGGQICSFFAPWFVRKALRLRDVAGISGLWPDP